MPSRVGEEASGAFEGDAARVVAPVLPRYGCRRLTQYYGGLSGKRCHEIREKINYLVIIMNYY
jgi:hypothetical protein